MIKMKKILKHLVLFTVVLSIASLTFSVSAVNTPKQTLFSSSEITNQNNISSRADNGITDDPGFGKNIGITNVITSGDNQYKIKIDSIKTTSQKVSVEQESDGETETSYVGYAIADVKTENSSGTGSKTDNGGDSSDSATLYVKINYTYYNFTSGSAQYYNYKITGISSCVTHSDSSVVATSLSQSQTVMGSYYATGTSTSRLGSVATTTTPYAVSSISYGTYYSYPSSYLYPYYIDMNDGGFGYCVDRANATCSLRRAGTTWSFTVSCDVYNG